MKTMNTMIVGQGRAFKNYSRILSKLPSFGVTAVIDLDSPDDGKSSPLVTLADIEKCISANPSDAVVLCARSPQSFEFAKAFLKNKIAVFLDRPLGSTVEECEALMEQSALSSTPLYVGYPDRFNPAIKKLKEIIGGGWLGEVVHFEVSRINRLGPNDNIRTLSALASIDIDILNFVAGEFSHMASSAFQQTGASLFLRSASGASACIHVNMVTPVKIRKMRVTGTRGYCDIDYILQTCTLYGGQLLSKTVRASLEYSEFVEDYKSVDEVNFGVNKNEPMVEMMNDFYRYACLGETPACSLQEAAYAVHTASKVIDNRDRKF